jgi:predicted amidohydrolase
MRSRFRSFLYDEQAAARRLTIASVAMTCDRLPEVNRTRMAGMVDAIADAHPGVQLVFFGEMILGWYNPGGSPQYHQRIAESIPGETTRALAALALKHEIFVCFGLSELDGDVLHNSQVLLNPRGEIQAVHRKRNLKPGERQANYQPGPRAVTITDIHGVRTGLVICSDTASPRIMWALMKSRLDLILLSLADDDRDDFASRFQARMYDAWLVTANRRGQEGKELWPGLIVLSDPLGEVRIAEQGREQYLIHQLGFADTPSWLKRALRIAWVRTPVIVHVLRNWKRARSYL